MTGKLPEVHDIVFAEVPFVEKEGEKYRPALVLSLVGEQIRVYKITTKYSKKSEYIRKRYFRIVDYAYAGLKKQSWIDTLNQIPLKKGTKIRISGRLSARDEEHLRDFLANLGVNLIGL